MDFIEGLPKSEGYSVILVVVDRLTKFTQFILIKNPCSAATIAQLFMENVVKLHGLPNSLCLTETLFLSVTFGGICSSSIRLICHLALHITHKQMGKPKE
jgi:hypothetical protein